MDYERMFLKPKNGLSSLFGELDGLCGLGQTVEQLRSRNGRVVWKHTSVGGKTTHKIYVDNQLVFSTDKAYEASDRFQKEERITVADDEAKITEPEVSGNYPTTAKTINIPKGNWLTTSFPFPITRLNLLNQIYNASPSGQAKIDDGSRLWFYYETSQPDEDRVYNANHIFKIYGGNEALSVTIFMATDKTVFPVTPKRVPAGGSNYYRFYVETDGKISVECGDEVVSSGHTDVLSVNRWIVGHQQCNKGGVKVKTIGNYDIYERADGSAYIMRGLDFFGNYESRGGKSGKQWAIEWAEKAEFTIPTEEPDATPEGYRPPSLTPEKHDILPKLPGLPKIPKIPTPGDFLPDLSGLGGILKLIVVGGIIIIVGIGTVYAGGMIYTAKKGKAII